jgi:hypothetical protein
VTFFRGKKAAAWASAVNGPSLSSEVNIFNLLVLLASPICIPQSLCLGKKRRISL